MRYSASDIDPLGTQIYSGRTVLFIRHHSKWFQYHTTTNKHTASVQSRQDGSPAQRSLAHGIEVSFQIILAKSMHGIENIP